MSSGLLFLRATQQHKQDWDPGKWGRARLLLPFCLSACLSPLFQAALSPPLNLQVMAPQTLAPVGMEDILPSGPEVWRADGSLPCLFLLST